LTTSVPVEKTGGFVFSWASAGAASATAARRNRGTREGFTPSFYSRAVPGRVELRSMIAPGSTSISGSRVSLPTLIVYL